MPATQGTPFHRYPRRMTLRVPVGLPDALEAAARLQLTSPAEYCRRALIRALRADGVRVDADGTITTRPT
jgi:hypothetical protein